MAAYHRVDDLQSPAAWLPVHRDQLRAQRSITSIGSLYPFTRNFTTTSTICFRVLSSESVVAWLGVVVIYSTSFTISGREKITRGKWRWAFQRSYSTSGPVSTGTGDHLWAGKPSQYVTSHPDQLSGRGYEYRPKYDDTLWLGRRIHYKVK